MPTSRHRISVDGAEVGTLWTHSDFSIVEWQLDTGKDVDAGVFEAAMCLSIAINDNLGRTDSPHMTHLKSEVKRLTEAVSKASECFRIKGDHGLADMFGQAAKPNGGE